MGKYYLFTVNINNNEDEKIFRTICDDELEYIKFNKYLNDYYGENIINNEDYIALTYQNIAYTILNEDNFDISNLEEVFEILYDSIYMKRGEICEAHYNC